jgi:hypothetical protein
MSQLPNLRRFIQGQAFIALDLNVNPLGLQALFAKQLIAELVKAVL